MHPNLSEILDSLMNFDIRKKYINFPGDLSTVEIAPIFHGNPHELGYKPFFTIVG